ncbi:universal stress protein [Arthrobacter crystallopoietes]|uniref:universal stress protein n=1 Tax=Crystallibacter crystallopoietes TaxID=37928 RepID=UPI001486E653|nr:universal stress protein [Arthrobacter crystallopoietes]
MAAVEPGSAAPGVLSAAADMALRHGLPLNVVTVGPGTDPDPALTDALDRIRRQHPKLQCRAHTLSGKPVHEIAEAARQSWLLVIGTRGISGLTGMVRGSVSQALLQHASSPVLVVPPGQAEQPE